MKVSELHITEDMIEENLYRTDEFESFFNACDFIEHYGTPGEMFYPMLVAWSRGYDEGFRKGQEDIKQKIFDELYARKEMGG
jgi:hypothetical protein